jgi:multiple sugar transport system ATP-binding protein
MSEPLVRIEGVSKSFGSFQAVKNVSLAIEKGEIFSLLGGSGCGKTTLLRMLAGFEAPTQGRIFIDGVDMAAVPPWERPVHMMFQSYALFPHMTVEKNVGYGLKHEAMSNADRQARVREMLELVQLTQFATRKPHQISGGQRQRVALARAIVRQPSVFLMDEPLSNLDAKLRVSTRAQIKNLSHELKVTTIYVTHDQIEAMTLADRVVVMRAGQVQQVGTPTQIYDRPANTFVAGFIGNPAMNLMDGRMQAGAFIAEATRIEGLDAPDGPITLGFRAEDARVSALGGAITASVYSMELLGDSTMVTVRAGGALVAVKAPKDYRIDIGQPVSIAIPTTACHLFNVKTGARLLA